MPVKSILITGCSSGIGYETAKILRDRGYLVFATARKLEDVARLQAEGFASVQLDVDDSNSIKKALDEILKKTNGRLDALFNNAGFLQVGAVEDLTRDVVRKQFETNVFGAMELIRFVLPIMRNQGHGRILQNSSILGVITMPFYGAYNASKYALEGFSNTLRQELHGTNIHVSVINPGPIKSDLRKNAYHAYIKQMPKHSVFERVYKNLEVKYFNKTNKTIAGKPSAVTKKVIHALESKNPKAHYFIGFGTSALAFTRRILPDKFLDWVISKISSVNAS